MSIEDLALGIKDLTREQNNGREGRVFTIYLYIELY